MRYFAAYLSNSEGEENTTEQHFTLFDVLSTTLYCEYDRVVLCFHTLLV